MQTSALRYFCFLLVLRTVLCAEYVGNLQGDLSMHQGQAVYNLPIELPKGPNNIQPKLSVVYNSQCGNGLLGAGWELDIISAIMRCPQTFAQDGRAVGIDYSSTDSYCLDGQRFVAVSGMDGADCSEYRTELDTYNKITAAGTHGTGPSSFRVWTKDGQVLDYGSSRNSQVIGTNQNSIHQWNLAAISDRSGNSVNLTYLSNTNFPSNIKYGTTTVSFQYESRPDFVRSYFKGSILYVTDKRLHSIEIMNPTTIRKYIFTYKKGGSGGSSQSLLESVKLCDLNGNCLRPLSMDYSSTKNLVESFNPYSQMINTFGVDSGWTVQDHPRFVRDMNGDGLPDIVGFASSGVYVALNNGKGQFTGGRYWVGSFGKSAGGWTGSKHPREVADVDGDGLPDVVGFANAGVYVSFNTGSSLSNPVKLVSTFGYDQGWRTNQHPRFVMDMNGDGRADVVGFGNAGVYVALSKGRYFDNYRQWSSTFGFTAGGWDPNKYLRTLRDVNGDGLPDVIGFGHQGVYVAINTGTTFLQHSTWSQQFHYELGWRIENHPRYVEDINGDGLADIVGFANAGVYVAFSTGTSFTTQQKVVSQFGYSTGGWRVSRHPRFVTDITGDGLPDIVGFANDGVYVSHNMGNGQFSSPKFWMNGFGYSRGGWRVENHPRHVVDVNGDGIADILGYGNAGVYVSLNPNRQPLIKKFVNSFGSVQSLSYLPLPQAITSGNYEKNSVSTYPLQYSVPPVNILTSIIWNEGTPASNTTVYHYGNLRFDVSGRGSHGFKWTKQVDSANRYVQTEYEQDFPLTGKVFSVKHAVPTSSKSHIVVLSISKTYNTTMHSSVHKVFPYTEEATAYEIDGSVVRQSKKKYFGTDGYGNILQTVDETIGGNQAFKSVTTNKFYNDDEKWLLGLLEESSTSHSCELEQTMVKKVTYVYDPVLGYLKQQILQPDDPNALLTAFSYDSYGNVISKSDAPLNDASQTRTVITTYDSKGIHQTSSTNSKGHSETYINDDHGNLISLIGANNLRTTWTHDLLGRKTGEHRADGTIINWSYNWDSTLTGAAYNIKMSSPGSPTKTRVFDALNKVIREQSEGYDGSDIYEDIVYNTMGHVYKHSFPYYSTSSLEWVFEEYDILDRLITKDSPSSNGGRSIKRTTYNRLITIEMDHLGRQTIMQDDVLGRLVKVTDDLGGTVHYKYDCVGNLVKTTDTDGHVTSIDYDILGNKISFSDPNMGHWKYQHNAFGELLWQQDANQNILQQEYDVLGRIVKRTEPEGETVWMYDTQQNGIGKVSSIQGYDGYSRSWKYDSFGREHVVETSIQGTNYAIGTYYDGYGRIIQEQFPNGETVHKNYTSNGFLKSISTSTPSKQPQEVWQAEAYDALGRITQEQFGNQLITNYEYDAITHLVGIKTHKSGSDDMLRNLHYEYDENDNLVLRQDLIQEATETFTYDNLDRLTQSTVVTSNGKFQKRHNWDYYGNGNIRFNDAFGLGQFIYHASKPHAVVRVGNHTYAYDDNGNMILRNGRAIQWSSFNKPVQFDTTSGNIKFKYGPDRQRYMKESSNGDRSIYLGKSYEIKIKNAKTTAETFVRGTMGKIVGIITLNITTNDDKFTYFHTDHLGSIDTTSDQVGNIVERFSYDAFGLRREGNWKTSTTNTQINGRGFTEHEHLDELGLIHMNGRVYDPLIGRFLSPDPHIQDPTNTQTLNRYTYALNNPLKHKDPTGFFFKKIVKFVKKYWRPIVAATVAVVTFGAAAPIAAGLVASAGLTGTAAAVASGALAGAVSGFAGGVVATGDIKGGLQGAAGGAIMGGIGGYFGNAWSIERVGAHATGGGITSEIGGGKFKDGFLKAGLSAGARFLYNKVVQYDSTFRSGGPAKYKHENQMPYEGRNNIGIQGKTPDPSWLDEDQFLGVNWGEGGGLSRMLNRVPGVNAVAGMHDVFQVKLDTVLFPGARDWFNVPGMPVAAAVTYLSLLDGPAMPALLVDETRKSKR